MAPPTSNLESLKYLMMPEPAALSSLGPVVEYPRMLISLEHVFLFFGPCDFYSDHIFYYYPSVVFIQTAFFQKVALEGLL